MLNHQYIDRHTQQVRDEKLYADRVVRALYSPSLERAAWLTRVASSQWISDGLATLNYSTLGSQVTGMLRFLRQSGVDLTECVDSPESFTTVREIFERKIRYWDCRPMPAYASMAVCPADSRALVGSLQETSTIFIKEKLFDLWELLGVDREPWCEAFSDGDFAVFRLTPEKYHYVHIPESGIVEDFYEIRGRYHSCNPGAVISLTNPLAKNRRVVTILNTDVDGGDGLGLIAIVEVVALMVGQIEQCYSSDRYCEPEPVECGMFVRRGQPKSLFRPGSSTVILLFQKGRIKFAPDLISNRFRADAQSRFSLGFKQTIVETEVAVRSPLATAAKGSEV
jgi:phosphatidylserine decarboxylase